MFASRAVLNLPGFPEHAAARKEKKRKKLAHVWRAAVLATSTKSTLATVSGKCARATKSVGAPRSPEINY